MDIGARTGIDDFFLRLNLQIQSRIPKGETKPKIKPFYMRKTSDRQLFGAQKIIRIRCFSSENEAVKDACKIVGFWSENLQNGINYRSLHVVDKTKG